MNSPAPRQQPTSPPPPLPPGRVDEEQMRQWLRLRRELTELHARLEYLKLMLHLGVAQ